MLHHYQLYPVQSIPSPLFFIRNVVIVMCIVFTGHFQAVGSRFVAAVLLLVLMVLCYFAKVEVLLMIPLTPNCWLCDALLHLHSSTVCQMASLFSHPANFGNPLSSKMLCVHVHRKEHCHNSSSDFACFPLRCSFDSVGSRPRDLQVSVPTGSCRSCLERNRHLHPRSSVHGELR